MIERIKDLEYKLVTRESRPEDRERIAQVLKFVVLELKSDRRL